MSAVTSARELIVARAAQEIADELFKQYGVKVEKRRIDVANIRNAGDFTVSVWLYAGITAEMTAKVEVG